MTVRDDRSLAVLGAFALAGGVVGTTLRVPRARRSRARPAPAARDRRSHAQRPRLRPHLRRRTAPRRARPRCSRCSRAHGVHATFFLVGEQVARNPSLAAEIVAAGHEIGLHCDRHRNQLRLAPRAVRADIERGAARIEETTGRPIARYRPPYGIFNATSLALVATATAGARCCGRTGGATGRRAPRPSRSPSASSAAPVAEGSVLLLHDADDYSAEGSWRRTVAALPARALSARAPRAALDARRLSTRTRVPCRGAKVMLRRATASGRASPASRRTRASTPESTTRISSSANAAPRQRRIPPPNGTHA